MSLYKKYCHEIFDEKGRLLKLSLNYPPDFNFAYDVADRIADDTPSKRALVWCNEEGEEREFTFLDIKENSSRMANVLVRSGIDRGDRVIVILKKHYEYWFAAMALSKIGAIMIPATHMLTVKDLVYRINASKASAIISTFQSEVPEKIIEAVREAEVSPKLWTVRKSVEGFRNLTEEMDKESSLFERIPTSADDPMVLYFTSGTTGDPKGVIHSNTYPLSHIVTARYWLNNEEDSLHFTVAETGWAKASWGKLYGQWLTGSAVMVYDFDTFDPRQLINIINKYRVTSFCAPPTVYRYLVRKDIPEMPSLRHASTAGETLSKEVFRKFQEKTGLRLHEGYGQTETVLILANFIYDEPEEGSLGTPSPFYNVELRRKDGQKAEIGEIGEIVIIPEKEGRQEGIFTGYLDNDEQYRHVWRDGVYHTGDAACMDEKGRFWFHGRFDDIIKTGGFRVGPNEVENVLMEHPAIAECSVIGVPDSLRGQAIKAVIVLGSGFTATNELALEIKEFCNRKLAEYKWIRIIEFVHEMPKTISGKIRKNILRNLTHSFT